jgi:hypothetical protein
MDNYKIKLRKGKNCRKGRAWSQMWGGGGGNMGWGGNNGGGGNIGGGGEEGNFRYSYKNLKK